MSRAYPRLAVIGGSQGFTVLQSGLAVESLPPISTPFGDSPRIHVLRSEAFEVLFLSRHGDEGYQVAAPFVNYRANIWALKELGVERIIAWSGPGSLIAGMPIGEMLVPDDIIDETHGRASTFFDGTGLGFIRQNPVFCPALREALIGVITARYDRCRSSDVYVCTQGPRLETRAEIRKYASYGATLVGMTLAPEAFLARELEMCYCPVCYVTNYAEGVSDRPYKPGVLFEGLLTEEESSRLKETVSRLPQVAIEALTSMPDERDCCCARAMERYRIRGDIGSDWRKWIAKQRP